jgi:hypothetical protein
LENGAIPSGIYQVSDDETLSTNELIQLFGVSLDKKKGFQIFHLRWGCRLGDCYLNTTTQNVCKN